MRSTEAPCKPCSASTPEYASSKRRRCISRTCPPSRAGTVEELTCVLAPMSFFPARVPFVTLGRLGHFLRLLLGTACDTNRRTLFDGRPVLGGERGRHR